MGTGLKPDTKTLFYGDKHYALNPEQEMHIIIRIICFFIGLFIIVNGIRVVLTPPYGDEPSGYVIIAVGIIIPILVQYIVQLDDKREA
jgi:hypothetical protein